MINNFDNFNDMLNVKIYDSATIQQYKSDVGFRTLMEVVKDNLYVISKFQQDFKWIEEQVENLAVSLIRGLPIPPIYVYRNNNGKLEILDGQQRILSLYFYYTSKYLENDKKYMMRYYDIIDGKEIEKEVEITYNKLPKEIKRKLDYTTITVIEINVDNKELRNKYLYKIFANLNLGDEISNEKIEKFKKILEKEE